MKKTLPGSAVDWYRSVSGVIVRHFGGVPLVTGRYPDGVDVTFSASLHGPPAEGEATVAVRGAGGRVQYLALTETALLHEAHRFAVEVHSWSPRADDPARVAFARVLIRPRDGRASGWATRVALVVRRTLLARQCDGNVMRDGPTSAAVWVPFGDGPAYDVVRAWLHALIVEAVMDDPTIDPSELHVSTNAVGRWSMVPYSLIGAAATTAVTPIRWNELDTIGAALPCDAVAARVADDVFDAEVRRIGIQRFAGGRLVLVSGSGHGQILATVRAVLADAKPHTAAEICREGIARGLLPATTLPAYVQHGIATLLDRERDRGEKPEFIVLPDGEYRLNVPVNPYAGFHEPVPDRSAIDPLLATLRATVVRSTPAPADDGPNIGAPFERAVADAFAFLGLDSTRFGGEGEPDVVATAPLGSLAYRVVVECKTVASVKLHGSAAFVVEAARMRDAVGAQYAVLLGLDFPDERAIAAELATHAVSLWTLEDLVAVLECQLHHPIRWSDLRPLFVPGRVTDAIAGFRAEHLHGAYTRARLAWQYAMAEGLAYQESLGAEAVVSADDGLVTAEVLALLVNQRMAREGMVGRCSVADARAAMAFASSPGIGAAVLSAGGTVSIEVRGAAEAVVPAAIVSMPI
jgi:DNA primase